MFLIWNYFPVATKRVRFLDLRMAPLEIIPAAWLSRKKSVVFLYKKSFIDPACSVKMAAEDIDFVLFLIVYRQRHCRGLWIWKKGIEANILTQQGLVNNPYSANLPIRAYRKCADLRNNAAKIHSKTNTYLWWSHESRNIYLNSIH